MMGTREQLWKIVDTFNGYESRTYQRRDEAETQLAANLEAFCAHPGHQHARFCQMVVPAHVHWGWDERLHKFVWA